MAPCSLFRVIVHWQKVAADWTRPLLSFGMLGIDIDPLRFDVQVYLLNSPRWLPLHELMLSGSWKGPVCWMHSSTRLIGKRPCEYTCDLGTQTERAQDFSCALECHRMTLSLSVDCYGLCAQVVRRVRSSHLDYVRSPGIVASVPGPGKGTAGNGRFQNIVDVKVHLGDGNIIGRRGFDGNL